MVDSEICAIKTKRTLLYSAIMYLKVKDVYEGITPKGLLGRKNLNCLK